MLRKIMICGFFAFAAGLQGNEEILPLTTASEESLFVRRIIEFWKDADYTLVKSQIKQFFTLYPHSEFSDGLQSILGDAYWNEEDFQSALAAYESIRSTDGQKKVFSKRMDCLYQLKRYAALIDQIRPRLQGTSQVTTEEALWTFYYAEALVQLAKQQVDSASAKQHYRLACASYESLLTSEHANAAKLALTEVYVALEAPQQAITILLDLSERQPENKEDLLFDAARIQASCDLSQALASFSRLQQMRGKRVGEAGLYKMVLLLDQGKHQDVFREAAELRGLLSTEQQPYLQFLLGRCYASLNQHEEAINTLKPLLAQSFTDLTLLPSSAKPNEKVILLLLMTSGHHLNELASVEEWSKRFELAFAKDSALARVLYIKALTYKNCDHFQEAQVLLERITKEFPSFEKMEMVQLESGVLLFQQRRWKECRQTCLAFIQNYPVSTSLHFAIQMIPKASLQLLKETELKQEPLEVLRKQLTEDLQLVMNTPGALELAENPTHLILLAKTQCELKQYPLALKTLELFQAQYPKDEQNYQAHLLMALCYRNGLQDMLKYIFHTEAALALKSNSAEQSSLHLGLFGAYLQLAKKNSQDEHDSFLEKASEHLYTAFIANPSIVSEDHRIWLANHFYNKVRKDLNEYAIEPIPQAKEEVARRSAAIIRSVIDKTSGVPLTPDTIGLELEHIKLSNLYGWLQEPEQQIDLLKSLQKQYQDHPEYAWKAKPRALFSLAYALQQKKEDPQALALYTQLALMKGIDPYVANAVKLNLVRLSFASLSQQQRTLDNPELLKNLQYLKDLQIRKVLMQEPTHLEAALDYAAIRSSLERLEDRNEQKLALLLRAKEEFSATKDIASQDYHASFQRFPDKARIYQIYMMLMDIQIAGLQSEIAKAEGSVAEANTFQESARELCEKLLQDPYTTQYVRQAVKKALNSER